MMNEWMDGLDISYDNQINVPVNQNKTKTMMSVDVPIPKQLLEYDFWHTKDRATNRIDRSKVKPFL